MGAEEGFLPVEFVSRSLRERRWKGEVEVSGDGGASNYLTSFKYAPDSGAIPCRIFIP